MPTPGLGQRLIERIRAIKAGIYRDDAAKFKIKVTEFALDHRYPPGSVFKWIGDVVVPDYETILRLARDLDTAPGWLHYGDEGDYAHGHGPSRGKVLRRQGRRTAGSLVLAFMAGTAALLGWPSDGASASPGSLEGVGQLCGVVAYRKWLQKAYRRLAQPLLCPSVA